MLSAAAVVDGQELVARCMGNRDLARRVLARFQSRLPEDMAELQEAFLAGDSELVAVVAHRLKGAAANVSARILRDRAAAIEELARRQSLTAIPIRLQELQVEGSRFADSVSAVHEQLGSGPAAAESLPANHSR